MCRHIFAVISIKKSENRRMNAYFAPASLILPIVQTRDSTVIYFMFSFFFPQSPLLFSAENNVFEDFYFFLVQEFFLHNLHG